VLSILAGAPGAVGKIAITKATGVDATLDPISLTAITTNS